MCGIVGAMSNYLVGMEIDRFKELMTVSNLRGSDGSGVIRVNKKQKVSYVRSAGTGIDVVKSDEFDELVKTGPNPTCLIGHTRWPTRGDNSVANSHPHHTGHIVGVHNGTMDRIMGSLVPRDRSDSALLFEAIAEHGIDKALRNSDGAMALVYCDTKEGTINFYRNYKRPLWFAVIEGQRTLYWASERAFLQLVLGRANQKFETVELEVSALQTYDLDVPSPITFLDKRNVYMYYNPPTHTPSVPRVIAPVQQTPATQTGTVPEVAPKDAPFRSEGPEKPTILHYPGASTSMLPRPRNDKPSSTEKSSGGELPDFLKRSATTSEKSSETHRTTTSTKKRFVAGADGTIRSKSDAGEAGAEAGASREAEPAVDDTADEWSRLETDWTRQKDDGTEIVYKTTLPNHYVSIRRYVELVHAGCQYCGETIEGPLAGLAKTPTVNWYEPTKWLCEDCAGDEDVIKESGADQYLMDQFSGKPKLHFWSNKEQRYVYE